MPGRAKNTTTFGYDAAGRWTTVANAASVDTFFVDNAERLGYVKSVRSGKTLKLWRTYATPSGMGRLVIARDSGATTIWKDSTGRAYDTYRKVNQLEDFAGKATKTIVDKAGRPLLDTLRTSAVEASRVRKTMTHAAIGLRTQDSFSGTPASLNRSYEGYYQRDLLGVVSRPGVHPLPWTRELACPAHLLLVLHR